MEGLLNAIYLHWQFLFCGMSFFFLRTAILQNNNKNFTLTYKGFDVRLVVNKKE